MGAHSPRRGRLLPRRGSPEHGYLGGILPRSTRPLLLAALAAVLLLVLSGVAAHALPGVRGLDADGAGGFVALGSPASESRVERIAELASPPAYTAAGLVLIAIALVRRRPRTAAATAILLVATGLTTQFLKRLVDVPRESYVDERAVFASSWPSGHATAAMTLALCAVLVAPAVLRPAAALAGAAYAAAVSYAILALAWHLPSDVVGGFLVAAGWTLVAVAALTVAEVRRPSPSTRRRRRASPSPPPRAARVLAGGSFAAATAAGVVILARAARTDFAAEHTTSLVGGAAIAVLAALLALGLGRAVREAPAA
jgi:membrane-associated phospholipid phosphatase